MAIVPDPLLEAATLPAIIGTIYILLHFSFVYLPNAFFPVPDPAISAIGTVLAILSPFFFFIVFSWAGWRAARRSHMGVVDSGSVSALYYVVVTSISIVLTVAFMISLPAIFHLMHGEAASSDFLSSNEVKLAGFGLVTVLVVYSASQLFFGAMFYFAIGCLAAFLAKRMG